MEFTGFSLVAPLYESGSLLEAGLRERRENLSGFIFASFVTPELFRSIFGERVLNDIDFEVFDSADCENLEEVLQRYGSPNDSEPHLFTHIRIDGLDLPEDSFSRLNEISIEGVERIEVESKPSVEIARSSLRG